MEKPKSFTVDEMNKMLLEAVQDKPRTSVQGEGAQAKYQLVVRDVAKMRKEGAMPDSLQD